MIMPAALARLTMLMPLLLCRALPTHPCAAITASTVVAGGIAV